MGPDPRPVSVMGEPSRSTCTVMRSRSAPSAVAASWCERYTKGAVVLRYSALNSAAISSLVSSLPEASAAAWTTWLNSICSRRGSTY